MNRPGTQNDCFHLVNDHKRTSATAPRDLAAEVGGVLVSKARPLFGQVVSSENGRHWADRNAGAAVDALHWIDEELLRRSVPRFILLGMNAIYRAGVHASCVFSSDAGFCDHVCHRYRSPEDE